MNPRRPPSISFLLVASFGLAALVACSGSSDTADTAGGAQTGGPSTPDSGGATPPTADSGGVTPPVTETDAGDETKSDGGKNGGDGGGHTDSGGGSGEGGAAGLGQACASTAQCSAAFPICFTFKAKGKHCTKTCATNADCPAGSGGCNGQKVCKVP